MNLLRVKPAVALRSDFLPQARSSASRLASLVFCSGKMAVDGLPEWIRQEGYLTDGLARRG